MALEPIKKRRLFEEIILALEGYIESEGIEPGERLPSAAELSARFNVSKTAIREALTVLHSNGIIESRAGVGIFLKSLGGQSLAHRLTKDLLDQREIKEILEFRRGIEVEAASLAALRARKADLMKMERAHEELVSVNKAGFIGVDEDFAFHHAIVHASQNSIYQGIYEELSQKLRKEIGMSKMHSAKVPGRFRIINSQHEEILKAIKEKNPHKASERMKKHLMSSEQKILSYFPNAD